MATVAGAYGLPRAICGSSPATAATFASVAVPEMDRYGYDKKLSTGIVATVEPWASSSLQRDLDCVRDHHRTIHWKIVFGWYYSSLSLRCCLSWSFTCVQDESSLGAKSEKSTWKQRISSLPRYFGWFSYLLWSSEG